MPLRPIVLRTVVALQLVSVGTCAGHAAEPSQREQQCGAVGSFFANEVWAKVGERTCLKCHRADGDAAASEFVLQDTLRNPKGLRDNLDAFCRMGSSLEDGASRLLVKAGGGLDHGGGEVLKADATGYRILQRFVLRLNGKADEAANDESEVAEYNARPFLESVQMMTPERLLRRVTLSLAARLPSEQELAAARQPGFEADDIIGTLSVEADEAGFQTFMVTPDFSACAE